MPSMTSLLPRVLGGIALAVVPSALLIWYVRVPPEAVETAREASPAAVSQAAPAGSVRMAQPMLPGHDAVASGPGIEAHVSLGEPGADWPVTARVFVFLRRAGERMPLAVEAFTTDDLPLTVSLARPASGGHLEVVARLSRSGSVTLDPGDLQAVAQVDGDQAGAVTLVLTASAPGVPES